LLPTHRLTQALLPKPPADIPQQVVAIRRASPEYDPETSEALRAASVKAPEIIVRRNYFAQS